MESKMLPILTWSHTKLLTELWLLQKWLFYNQKTQRTVSVSSKGLAPDVVFVTVFRECTPLCCIQYLHGTFFFLEKQKLSYTARSDGDRLTQLVFDLSNSCLSCSLEVASFCCMRSAWPLVTPQLSGVDIEGHRGRPEAGFRFSQ